MVSSTCGLWSSGVYPNQAPGPAPQSRRLNFSSGESKYFWGYISLGELPFFGSFWKCCPTDNCQQQVIELLIYFLIPCCQQHHPHLCAGDFHRLCPCYFSGSWVCCLRHHFIYLKLLHSYGSCYVIFSPLDFHVPYTGYGWGNFVYTVVYERGQNGCQWAKCPGRLLQQESNLSYAL